MDLILDIGPKNLEKVLYFAAYIVLDPGTTDIPFKKILTEQEYKRTLRPVRKYIPCRYGC